MSNLNQKGVIQFLPLLIIIAGLVAGLYLVQHPTIFKPKAQTPISAPIACKTGIRSYSFQQQCDRESYQGLNFSCYDGSSFKETGERCRSVEEWKSLARERCKGKSSCTSTTLPSSAPRRLYVTPNTTTENCIQVITRACSPDDPAICKEFPTPCDVPEGWIKQSP